MAASSEPSLSTASATSRPVRTTRGKRVRGDDFLEGEELIKAIRHAPRRRVEVVEVLDEGYPVKSVLEHKMNKNGDVKFLVEWEEVGSSPTWEPEDYVGDEAKSDYEERYASHFMMLPAGMRGEEEREGWRRTRGGVSFLFVFSPLSPLTSSLLPSFSGRARDGRVAPSTNAPAADRSAKGAGRRACGGKRENNCGLGVVVQRSRSHAGPRKPASLPLPLPPSVFLPALNYTGVHDCPLLHGRVCVGHFCLGKVGH